MAAPNEVPIGSLVQEFPAGSFNKLVQDYRNRRAQPPERTEKTLGAFGVGPRVIVFIANESGADVEPGQILGIDGPSFDLTDDANQVYAPPVVKGVTPTLADHSDAFVITLDHIEDGKVGPAVLSGLAWVRLNVNSESDTHAKVKDADSSQLDSSTSGPAIIKFKESGTGADKWALVKLGSGAENFRLIRGESVGNQSGGTILIDNVDVLAGGLDPSGGDPGVQVTVQNIFGQSFTDNEAVQAIYNEDLGGTDLTDWEAIKTSSGTETYRAIRGLTKGAVAASATTFVIDNVIPLAGGNDPVSGNPATEITVQNIQKEAFADNEPITAIYDGADWEVLLVERYRMIRGRAVGAVSSGPGTFTIDNIEVLESGLDPRSDPTSESETVTVNNFHEDAYSDNEWVTAVWNVVENQWEALKKSSGAEAKYTADLASPISAAAPNALLSGSATVYEIAADGSESSLGSKTVWHGFRHAIKGALTVLKLDDDNYLVAAPDILEVLYLLDGAAEKKALALPEGEAGPTDIQWLGEECA